MVLPERVGPETGRGQGVLSVRDGGNRTESQVYVAPRHENAPAVEKNGPRALQPDPLPASSHQKLTSLTSAGALLMTFPRLRFAVLVTSSCAAFAFACGGISDPTKGNGSEKVATVSGALTGISVPANARVALVWRTAATNPSGGGYAVGDDVAVVDGKFTMGLSVPPAAYFEIIESDEGSFSSSSSGGEPPNVGGTEPAPQPAPAPAPGGGSSSGGGGLPPGASRITPRDNVSGGFSNPLSGAVAGFVVYADTNGNGKLDLAGTHAASTDQILGGNKELVLAYLKDGGGLDYEKLRDTSGILPTQGFNLAWTQGKRWMPLNVVQLKLDPNQGLPRPVCSSSGSSGSSSGSGDGTGGFDPVATPVPPPSGGSGGSSGSTPPSTPPGSGTSSSGGSTSGGPGSYPSPTDPNLHCAPDGRSFSYYAPTNCPPSPPPPVGLCAGESIDIAMPCASGGYGSAIPSGEPAPPGWPCPIAEPVDGGPAPIDAGGGG
jgi:hypothetical protein